MSLETAAVFFKYIPRRSSADLIKTDIFREISFGLYLQLHYFNILVLYIGNNCASEQLRTRTDGGMADGDQAARSLNEARERLKQRKKRRTTSCWPCRDRKVKCDKSRPCDTCLKRGHSDLCTYERVLGDQFSVVTPLVNPNGLHNSPASGGSATPGPGLQERPVSHPDGDSSTVLSHGTIQNSSSTSPKGGRPEPFLGQNSIPHFVRDQTSAEDATGRRGNVEEGLMPILGLQDSPSDYPFLPTANDKNSIYDALPSDREIIR